VAVVDWEVIDIATRQALEARVRLLETALEQAYTKAGYSRYEALELIQNLTDSEEDNGCEKKPA